MEKDCFKCGTTKPIEEFYKHRFMADGHLNKCKECARFDVRKHRAENDSVREYDRRRAKTPEKAKSIRQIASRWQKKHPERANAHRKVSRAVANGSLVKGPCTQCGSTKCVHGHHHDYSKPLDVTWLCARCHAGVTRDENRNFA